MHVQNPEKSNRAAKASELEESSSAPAWDTFEEASRQSSDLPVAGRTQLDTAGSFPDETPMADSGV